jgi:hypothetical protein
MFPRIIGARFLRDYTLEVRFSDGIVAELDFRQRIVGRGGVFKALESIDNFSQVAFDAEAGTIVWPNGVDFCPDVLYAEASGQVITDLRGTVEVS